MKILKTLLSSALLMAAALPSLAVARDDSAAEKLGFKLGTQAYTFRMVTFFEAIDNAKTLGLKYIESYPGQKLSKEIQKGVGPGLSEEETATMLAKLKESGVTLVSFGVASVPTDETGARKHFDWAKKVGLKVFVTETPPTELHDKLCKEYDMKFALHNHPASWPAEKVLEASKGMSNRIGSCYDTGHAKRAGRDTVETMKLLGERVLHCHFKDVAPNASGKGFEDVIWGTGQCRMADMMAELKALGFNGYLMIEYEHGTEAELMENLPKCITFFDKTAAELTK